MFFNVIRVQKSAGPPVSSLTVALRPPRKSRNVLPTIPFQPNPQSDANAFAKGAIGRPRGENMILPLLTIAMSNRRTVAPAQSTNNFSRAAWVCRIVGEKVASHCSRDDIEQVPMFCDARQMVLVPVESASKCD